MLVLFRRPYKFKIRTRDSLLSQAILFSRPSSVYSTHILVMEPLANNSKFLHDYSKNMQDASKEELSRLAEIVVDVKVHIGRVFSTICSSNEHGPAWKTIQDVRAFDSIHFF